MQRTPRRDTKGELALRRAVHALGLRYRVDQSIWKSHRHKVDIVFRAARVLVYFDGCFWHGCPTHFTCPTHNSGWWRAKVDRTVERDRENQRRAEAEGWYVIRVWEHDDIVSASARIVSVVRARTQDLALAKSSRT
jgi:DNA mismatch endonuclease (patch repair protein)